MRKAMKAVALAAMAGVLALCLAACASGNSNSSTAASHVVEQQNGKHIIGVAVYDVSDSEVLMFRQYLQDYLGGECYDDVQFVYSESLANSDEVLKFIDTVAAMGGEGVMSFYGIDLAAEVERCASHGMYHMIASGTVSDESFAKVQDNKYFLGAIGPGAEMEYLAGSQMAMDFAERGKGNRYFIMSGGAAQGNEMHFDRVRGMIDELANAYGVDVGNSAELARVTQPTTVAQGALLITVSPGYLSVDSERQSIESSLAAESYDYVLSALAASRIQNALDASGALVGMVDCYSQDNQLLFQKGKLSYVAGKYGSLVGPSFMAMYNAIHGYAADFRDNGKAFRIKQDFWSSNSAQDFNDKYEFASNSLTPAYNFQDLNKVCRVFSHDASLNDLTKLAEASSFQDAKARRGL